jgi:predicted transcriptional regulator of viral defense system
MHKKNYLSKEEQIIFTILNKTDIIDNEQIKEIFPHYPSQKINKLCHNLISKGYLHPIKKGIYIINDTSNKKPIISNPFKLAHYINKGYIGFSSALRIYDLISYEPFTIFTITKNKSNELTIGNYLFKTVSMGKKATGTTYYKNVYTSTIEKTIFDCFYKPQYAGGYRELTKALTNIKKINWDHVLFYFNNYASSSLFQRTGYILELLKEEENIHPPKHILKEFKKHIKNTTKLIPSRDSKGKYIKQWKLLDNLGKKTILSR